MSTKKSGPKCRKTSNDAQRINDVCEDDLGRTQIELLAKTNSELRDTVKSPQSILATVFPAINVG